MYGCMVVWLVGSFGGWLSRWLVGWLLVGWLLFGWSVGWLVFGLFVGGQYNRQHISKASEKLFKNNIDN